MNEEPLDKNESIIDIFVLSISESLAPQLTEHLEEKGYRVTLFSNSTSLLETLREGKPNLLICDTTTVEDGFEVCRRIKADSDLWVIPVLIFTSASTLADLLNVLDCNADNFLSYPSDLPYRLSLIESMLTTPVERQTPDLIKTQFKINHEDRIYVVAASRRKILEFLLSSFEIAVNKSSELSELKMEIQKLTESAETLEESVTEHTCVIDLLNASVKQKEQKIIALTSEGTEKERALSQKTEEISQLAEELEAEKTRIATKDENIRSMIREKEEIESFHRSETDALRQQVSGLLTQIDTAQTRLDSVQREFEEKKTHCISLESTLQEIITQKDLAEKTLHTLIPEHEQLKSAFEGEKNRAISAEEEIQAVMGAKAQSEQDLNEKITGLNQTMQQMVADLTRLKGELETEKNGRVSAEEQLGPLRQQKEQLESSLQSAINELNEQFTALQGEYKTACTALENKESMIKSLERNLAESVAEKEKTEEKVKANQVLYDTTVTELNEALAEATAIRSALETDLAAAKTQVRKYADELTLTSRGREESGQQVRSLTGELSQVKEALEKKESLVKSLRENLAGVVAEKDKTEERVKTDMESYKATFIRLKHDLDETLASRRTLEKDLAAAKTQNMAYAEELALANRSKEQSGKQIRLLVDELEQAKTELDTVRSQHRGSNENQEAVVELNSLNARLENERKLRLIAEEKTNAAALEQKRLEEELRAVTEERDHQEHDRALKIQNLKKDLESVCDLQKSLEEEVSILNEEKLKAEQRVQALTLELGQARTALADEWEDHMTTDEQLAAAVLERQRLQHTLSKGDLAGAEKEKVQEVIAKEPDLPVKIDPAFHSLELVINPEIQTSPVSEDEYGSHKPSAETAGETPETDVRSLNFSGLEDLFEENEPTPKPVKDNEPEAGRNGEKFSPETEDSDAEEEDLGCEDDEYDKAGAEEEPEQDYTVPDVASGAIPGPVFSFNRRQWLGLIKWAHHSEAISRDQRLQIIRMGRLIQKNRKLTREQEDQIREMITLVQALGYRPE